MIGPVLSAVAFLTRLPVPNWVHTEPGYLQRAAPWFPLVGMLLGGIYAGFALLALHCLSVGVVAVLAIGLDAVLTGALHLDGLADMADGFGGGATKSREEVLRIMRDHSVGSYGAVALILVLLLKAACLSNLLASGYGTRVLLVAPALSRWSILLLSRSAPYARTRSSGPTGVGALSRTVTATHLFIGAACCLPLFLVCGVATTGCFWIAVTLCTLAMAWISYRQIGGFTGDVLGANTVLTEALQYLIGNFLFRA